MQEINPYAPPTTDLIGNDRIDQNQFELADRTTRLGASLLDGLIVTIPWCLILWSGYALFNLRLWDLGSGAPGFFGSVGLSISGSLIYLLFNSKGLAKSGQTIGKRLMKIRIAKEDGNVPTLWDSFFKRYMIVMLVGCIPFGGSIIGLINPLMIFRSNRRCLHDDFAGTIVIKAR